MHQPSSVYLEFFIDLIFDYIWQFSNVFDFARIIFINHGCDNVIFVSVVMIRHRRVNLMKNTAWNALFWFTIDLEMLAFKYSHESWRHYANFGPKSLAYVYVYYVAIWRRLCKVLVWKSVICSNIKIQLLLHVSGRFQMKWVLNL